MLEAKRRCDEDDKKAPGRRMEAGLRAILDVGKLPQIAMHERSKRWAVKLFLAHWFEEAYRQHHKAEPPLPYPIAQMGHVHYIPFGAPPPAPPAPPTPPVTPAP
jgi:hypothetical protein